MDIIKGIAQERCSTHGEGCKCTPGVVTEALELWAECTDCEVSLVQLVCCDNGHEFVFASAEGSDRGFGQDQRGHVWSDGPKCRLHCPNHGRRNRSYEGPIDGGDTR